MVGAVMTPNNSSLLSALASGATALLLAQGAYAQEGAAQRPVAKTGQGIAVQLGLPVAKPAYYFNRATNTAFQELCVANNNSVKCRLDVLGLTAQIAHSVHSSYGLDKGGSVAVHSGISDVQEWSPALSSLYRSFKRQASAHSWSASSPLVRIADNQGRDVVQNNIYQVATLSGQDGVSVCSTVPVNEKRGFDVCLSFDRAGGTVSSAALPRVGSGSLWQAPLSGSAAASRGFNSYDNDHYVLYRGQIGADGAPSYVLRRN